ncbi:MAG: peptidoglycan recognition family protein [Planctomycetota bacterium]|nr:peptidoglycan recognition family protein [Planctomycetota bacterium]
MCETIPQECLPLPGSRPAAGGHHSASQQPWGLDRRVVLAGLGSLLLTACAPARSVPARPPVSRRPAPPEPKLPPYRIVRRSEWGAEALKPNHDPMQRVRRITLHHTAEVAGQGTRSDAELVKGIQDFHRNKRGWADIGYHWIIGLDGHVYEGRALDVQGAHAGSGNNGENLGISVIGDFTQGLPPARQLRTTQRFLEAQLAYYGIPIDELHGHRDLKPTECPGSALYAWLQRFKSARVSA